MSARRSLRLVSGGVRSALILAFVGLSFAGCASVLGIDNEYVEAAQTSSGGTPSASGGKAATTGGDTGSGGAPASGGTTASGGKSNGSGGAVVASGGTAPGDDGQTPECIDGSDECGARHQCCAGHCVEELPISGCGDPTCTPCSMPPAAGIMECVSNTCSIKCNDGFKLVDDTCEPIAQASGGAPGSGGTPSTGGTPASGGSGGAPEPCSPAKCKSDGHACNPAGPLQCCKNDGSCGCTWAPGGYCL